MNLSVNQIAQPITMRQYTIKNRLAKAAMSEGLGGNRGRVKQAHLALYQTWARGGVGLSITGNVMVDARAKNEPGVVVAEDEHELPMLARWAEIGQAHDMIQIVQLSHPGKQAPTGLNKENVAPSAIGYHGVLGGVFPVPRALREAEILDIIQRFGESARICKKAGFEGVQVHGAHGYLVSQFLSPLHNTRTDQWGGSIENRMRFVVEVYKEIRRQTGDDFIVGIKLNSADFQRGGFDEIDAEAVYTTLDKLGIDFIEISGGTYEAPAMTGVNKKQSTTQREAYFLSFAEKIRKQVKTRLMVTGGFRTVAAMNAAVASGACDFVGIARPFAVETDVANRLLSGADVRYAIKPIKTGVSYLDKMAIMEVVWYAAQFRAIAMGSKPDPYLSPLKVMAKYAFNNVKAVVRGRTQLRA